MSAANPSYKPSEGKREEFRKYLEKNGVMDALTRVLVNLYEETEKPEDALEYIRDKLADFAGQETYKQLQQKLTEAEDKVKELEAQIQGAGQTGDATEGSISQSAAEAGAEEQPANVKTEENPEATPPETTTAPQEVAGQPEQ